MVRDRIITTSLRSIRSSSRRFLSLLVMSLLGVGVFVGIQATAPDMMRSLDAYYDGQGTYDLHLVSTLGLTDGDLQAIRSLDGIGQTEGGWSSDVIIQAASGDYVVRVYSCPRQLDVLTMGSGRLPQAADEIAIEPQMMVNAGLQVGDTLTFDPGDTFATGRLTIVGTATTPLYIHNAATSADCGNTSLATGKVSYYAFVCPSCFKLDCYTDIWMTAAGANGQTTNDTAYRQLVDRLSDRLEDIRADRQQARYQQLFDSYSQDIAASQAQADRQLADAAAKIKVSQAKLDDAKAALTKAQARLDAAQRTLQDTALKLADARRQLDDGWTQVDAALASQGLGREGLPTAIAALGQQAEALRQQLADPALDPAQAAVLGQQLDALQDALQKLATLQATVEALRQGEDGYALQKAQYDQGLADYRQGQQDYALSARDWQDGAAKLRQAQSAFDDAKRQAADALAAAKDRLAELKPAQWHIYQRSDDAVYSSFIDDADSIANLAKVFPTVFFAVAIMISLVCMSRMVQDDRTTIGTLKSMGFSDGAIMSKYMIYSGLAALSGGIVGAGLGMVIIPRLIWNIYTILFDLPAFMLAVDWGHVVMGLAICAACICGTTLLTVMKALRQAPAALMRPQAPANGRRVVLEHVGFVWRRLSFSRKVTVRNLFRYRRRVAATIGGIMGCTALMLSGFGLRDAIVGIPTAHFGGVFTYDEAVFVDPDAPADRLRTVTADLAVTAAVAVHQQTSRCGIYDVNLLVPEQDDRLAQAVSLRSVTDGRALTLTDGQVIISDKLAQLTGLAAGRTITITDNDGRDHQLTIAAVCVNYVGHYVFMNKAAFQKQFGPYQTNVVFIRTIPLDEHGQQQLVRRLSFHKVVAGVGRVSSYVANVEDMLKSLDNVVVILIVLSAALSFAVMYNLSYINISEREREIATLKVLGFRDREVDSYIIRENHILAGLGIALGLALGVGLTGIIVSTVEIQTVRFLRGIAPTSFLWAALLTAAFMLIVNFLTHLALGRIDMIESLKSVE